MQNQNGIVQSNALVFFIVLVVIIAGVLLFGQNKSAKDQVKQNNASSLNSLKVAIIHANRLVNQQALEQGVSHGKGNVLIEDISLGVFNGYISARSEDIKNALGYVFNGQQSITPSTINWQFQQVDTSDGIAQMKIFDPSAHKEDCYLLYREAGSGKKAAQPTTLIVDKGC